MSSVNTFTWYKQQEDDFTNGLIAILSLSVCEGPELVASFEHDALGIVPAGAIHTFRVLKGIDGTADAELSGADCCLRFETKTLSGALRVDQVDAHLEKLRTRPESVRRLILLTPDDSGSQYVKQFLSRDAGLMHHISWRRVYDFLLRYVAGGSATVFSTLVSHYLARIHETVFEQDFAGVIVKVQFGDHSEVYENKYLDDMKAGLWTQWNTPREYKGLDGTGRKLLLYHKGKGITAEIEIERVEWTNVEPDYPWSNVFAPGTLRIFDPPIPLSHIRSVADQFQYFGVPRKDRSPNRNITHEHYRRLTAAHSCMDSKSC